MSEKFPENANPDRSVVAVGNIIDGCRLFGPFDCPADAVDWAENMCPAHSWLVVPLKTVQCDENGCWI